MKKCIIFVTLICLIESACHDDKLGGGKPDTQTLAIADQIFPLIAPERVGFDKTTEEFKPDLLQNKATPVSKWQPFAPTKLTATIPIGKSKKVDILLVLDVTRSMVNYLREVADHLPDLLSEFPDDGDWHIKLVSSDPPDNVDARGNESDKFRLRNIVYAPPGGTIQSQPLIPCSDRGTDDNDLFLFRGIGRSGAAFDKEQMRFKEVLKNISDRVKQRNDSFQSNPNLIEAMFYNAARALTCDRHNANSKWLRKDSGIVVIFVSEANNCDDFTGRCPDALIVSTSVKREIGIPNYSPELSEHVSMLLKKSLPSSIIDGRYQREFTEATNDRLLHSRVFGILATKPALHQGEKNYRFPFTYLGEIGKNDGIIPKSGGKAYEIKLDPALFTTLIDQYKSYFREMSSTIKPYFPNPVALSSLVNKETSLELGSKVTPDLAKQKTLKIGNTTFTFDQLYSPATKSFDIPDNIIDASQIGQAAILEVTFTPVVDSTETSFDFLPLDGSKTIDPKSIIVTLNDEQPLIENESWKYIKKGEIDQNGEIAQTPRVRFLQRVPEGATATVNYSYAVNGKFKLEKDAESIVDVYIDGIRIEDRSLFEFSSSKPREFNFVSGTMPSGSNLKIVFYPDRSQSGVTVNWHEPVNMDQLAIEWDKMQCPDIETSVEGRAITLRCKTNPHVVPVGAVIEKKPMVFNLTTEQAEYFQYFVVTCNTLGIEFVAGIDWIIDPAAKTLTVTPAAMAKIVGAPDLACIVDTNSRQ